jgi:DNA-binding transcriptional ArsR family regulator
MDAMSAALFRLLGDEARLRLLRLLAAERLNVSELTGILGIAQSGVSRHLGLLKEAGLIIEEREAGYTYFRPADDLGAGGNGHSPLAALLKAGFDAAALTETGRADDARLAEVRRLRKENFDAHAGPDTNERQLVPGRSWAAWSRALGHLLPPLRDASVDVALLSQALHHAPDPARALAEAARVAVPGGRVLVLDLRQHEQQWVRNRLGDRWLGFADDALAKLLRGAGLQDIRVTVGSRRTGDPFTVIVASGRKPGAKGARISKDPS